MNGESRVTVRWGVLLAAGVALLAVGGGGTYLALRPKTPAPAVANGHADQATASRAPAVAAPASAPSPPAPSAALPDVVVTLSKGGSDRAGIKTATVAAATGAGSLRAPGSVEPNAYKQAIVTPIVSGRITRVVAELGQQVQRGQMIAQIFSPEMAEAETRYISARAMLEAHDKELARTEKLVDIGAASRQELERIHAEHVARIADVQSAVSRLQLLGVSAAAIQGLGSGTRPGSTMSVAAPMAGVVTERLANVGVNVDQSTKLFTIVDLSTVWVVADLYEKDFARVHVGSAATLSTQAYPDLVLQGRVSYIDPQVSSETRTAKVRIEVQNTRQQLRLGMYVEAVFAGEADRPTPTIPRSAVQNVGDRTVVYLVNPKEPGKFIEREVRLGPANGSQISVLTGLRLGDVVVGEGSFYLRAERERLGLRNSGSAASPPREAPPVAPGAPASSATMQEVRIKVTETSFDPARVTLKAGMPARLVFTRTTDQTCATAVVFPSLNVKRDLPLNQAVAIEFVPNNAGDIAFSCGMNMLHGTVVAQ